MKAFRWQLAVFLLGILLVGTIYLTGRRAENAADSGAPAPAGLLDPDFEISLSSDEPAAACTPDGLVRGGMVAQGMIGRPVELNPLLADGNPVDESITALIFDGLTTLDFSGSVVPALAETWEVADDNRTLVFQLKEGLTWHDGTPVTAADVLFTYTLLQDPLIHAELPDGAVWNNVTVEALDNLTVRVTLAAPYSPFLRAATRGILPAHLLENVSAAELVGHPFNQQPVGTGPFRVVNDWTSDGTLLLAPAAGRWPQRPILERLQIRFYPNEDALLAAFETDEIQLTGPLDPALVPRFLAADRAALITGYRPALTQLVFNVSETGPAPLQDRVVRQVLSQSIDPDQLVQNHLEGQAIPLVGPFLHGSWVNIPQDVPAIDMAGRQTAAAEALTANGWLQPEADGENGVRTLGDAELAAAILVPAGSSLVGVAEGVVNQWQPLGGRFAVEAVAPQEYRERLRSREFEAALVDVSMTAGPDLYDFWSQEAIVRGQNIAGWNHRRASEALEAARTVWPDDARRQFYQAFYQFFQDEIPAVTLYQEMTIFAYSATIEGLDAGPVYFERDRFASFERWSLPQNRASCQEQEE